MTQKRPAKQTAAKQLAKKPRKEPTPDPPSPEKKPKKGKKSIYICKNMVPEEHKNMISSKVRIAI